MPAAPQVSTSQWPRNTTYVIRVCAIKNVARRHVGSTTVTKSYDDIYLLCRSVFLSSCLLLCRFRLDPQWLDDSSLAGLSIAGSVCTLENAATLPATKEKVLHGHKVSRNFYRRSSGASSKLKNSCTGKLITTLFGADSSRGPRVGATSASPFPPALGKRKIHYHYCRTSGFDKSYDLGWRLVKCARVYCGRKTTRAVVGSAP